MKGLGSAYTHHSQLHTHSANWYRRLAFLLAAFFYSYQFFLRESPAFIVKNLFAPASVVNPIHSDNSFYFYAFYVPMQLVAGYLFDRFPSGRILISASFLCVLGISLYTISPNVYMDNLGFSLAAIGSAFAFVGALKTTTLYMAPSRFGMMAGLITSFGMLGAAINTLYFMPNITGYNGKQFDISLAMIGCALILAWVCIYQLDKHELNANQKHQHLFKEIMAVVKNPYLVANGIVGCILYLPLLLFAKLFGPSFLQQVYHFTNSEVSYAIGLIFLGWVVGAPLLGWLADSIRERVYVLTAGAVLSAIFISIILYVPILPVFTIYCLLFLFGFFCSAQVIIFALALNICNKNSMGITIGLTNFLVMASTFLTLPFSDILMQKVSVTSPLSYFPITSYQLLFAILPIGLIIAVLISLFLHHTTRES